MQASKQVQTSPTPLSRQSPSAAPHPTTSPHPPSAAPHLPKKVLNSHQKLQPFFQGESMKKRMEVIRKKFIEPIRRDYCQEMFETNMALLKTRFKNQKLSSLIDQTKFYYWYDKTWEVTEFKLLELLTNEVGSETIGSLIRDILRDQQLPEDDVRLAVFLVEAVNIELFFFTASQPSKQNFTGRVYRGFTCSLEDYNKFKILMQESPRQNRMISVPLSLWSSSKSLEVAESFLRPYDPKEYINIILAVDVRPIQPQLLAQYRQGFPQSQVLSICAVDISELSQFPEEEEVLLRGCFCQVLDYVADKQAYFYDTKYHMFHCAVVNSNRDHISTNSLGDLADSAREVYANICKLSRFKFCEEYYKQNVKFASEEAEEVSNYFRVRRKEEERKRGVRLSRLITQTSRQ